MSDLLDDDDRWVPRQRGPFAIDLWQIPAGITHRKHRIDHHEPCVRCGKPVPIYATAMNGTNRKLIACRRTCKQWVVAQRHRKPATAAVRCVVCDTPVIVRYGMRERARYCGQHCKQQGWERPIRQLRRDTAAYARSTQ